MKQGYFIAGTDTGVGKTLVAAGLVYGFAQLGLASAGMKPVAAGCRRVGGCLLSDDVEQLRAAANVALPPETVNPYAFEPPLAPHIAARMAGTHIELERVRAAFHQASEAVDVLVVEGVGGFRVPLNEHEDTADLAAMLALPVVLVVGMRLGCLNHALLTAEAIAARGLQLGGWVANQIDPAMTAFEENVAALESRLNAPRLATLPFREVPDWHLGEMANMAVSLAAAFVADA